MDRGKTSERVVAALGLVAWFGGAILGILERDYFWAAVFLALGALSVVEVRRWLKGRSALPISGASRATRGLPALPVNSWFAAGGAAGVLLLGLGWGVVEEARGASPPSGVPFIAAAVAWIVPGFLTQWLLTRRSDARLEADGRSIPPPPAPTVLEHARVPFHNAGDIPSTRRHLQDAHNAPVEADTSLRELASIHAGLHQTE